MSETIFADANLRATLHAPEASKLVVTFDNRKPGKTGFEPRDPARHFLKAGFAQLHIETSSNDWFVNPSTPALEKALKQCVMGYRLVRAIGFSMGGFGALRFSGTLGVTEVALISPQISLDPEIVPFERRYRQEARGFDRAIGALGSANPDLSGIICYDPFIRLDTAHASLITGAFPGIRRVPMALGRHPATGILRAHKGIGVVQKQVVRGFDGPTLKDDYRDACRITPLYWERLAEKAEAKHPVLAARARAKAAALRAKNT